MILRRGTNPTNAQGFETNREIKGLAVRDKSAGLEKAIFADWRALRAAHRR